MVSERGEVEVLLPLSRWPANRLEMRQLMAVAFDEAKRLIAPHGRVLGMSKLARAATPEGDLAYRVTFAAEAPETTWPKRTLH